MAKFEERLRELRLEKRLTHEQLAQRIGDTTASAISMWEAGKRFPRKPSLIKLCDIFGVSYNYLMGTSPYRNEQEQSFWDSVDIQETPDIVEAKMMNRERLGKYYSIITKLEVLSDSHKKTVEELIDVYYDQDK